MTARTLLVTLAAGAVLFAAAPLFAQPEDPPPGPGPAFGGPGGPCGPGGPARGRRPLPPELREKLLEKFDEDGDGHLSPEERKAARQALRDRMKERHEKMLEKFDADSDGKLNEDERQAARQAHRDRMKERHEKMLEKFDADGDGQLSKEERKAWLASLPEPVRKRLVAHHKRRQKLLEKFDADGDGHLSPEERRAARQAWRERIQERRDEWDEGSRRRPGGHPDRRLRPRSPRGNHGRGRPTP